MFQGAFSVHPSLPCGQWHIMPLFAHWRHPAYALDPTISSGVGEGAPPSSTHNYFCTFDDDIERRLVDLHHASQQQLYKVRLGFNLVHQVQLMRRVPGRRAGRD
jgi:hypothetical protein